MARIAATQPIGISPQGDDGGAVGAAEHGHAVSVVDIASVGSVSPGHLFGNSVHSPEYRLAFERSVIGAAADPKKLVGLLDTPFPLVT